MTLDIWLIEIEQDDAAASHLSPYPEDQLTNAEVRWLRDLTYEQLKQFANWVLSWR